MASVLQTLFSLPAFQTRYNTLSQTHAIACNVALPADCVECQMHKIADGLLSGRYSLPANYTGKPSTSGLQHPSPTPLFQDGIRPVSFKALIGKGHEEFSTMRQQDSEEFFTHLITVLRRDMHKDKDRSYQGKDLSDQILANYIFLLDPTTIFSYGVEQRLQCSDCKKLRYRVDPMDVVSVAVPAHEKGKDADGKVIYEEVQLTQCLEALLGSEALEYSCPHCRRTVHAIKSVVSYIIRMFCGLFFLI
jgi:ubiquitin carboxyl-terminal hydrolase 5/13